MTSVQKQHWDDKGYLVLPRFFSRWRINSILRLYRSVWKDCPDGVVVDDLHTGKRRPMSSLSAEEKSHRFKLNNLYLQYDRIRKLCLNKRLVPMLQELLGDEAVLCNTLSLDFGTQQPLHIDSLFMTPETDNCLVATWIALEDCHPDSGPLAYVPGSHKIPIYRFSTGTPHVVEQEFRLWQKHIDSHVSEMGLTPVHYLPKKGDVLIWHCQLLHGGAPVVDQARSRKSIVSHYWGLKDCSVRGHTVVPFNGAYWMDNVTLDATD